MSTNQAQAQSGSTAWVAVGSHKYRFDKDDLFITEMNGDLSAEELGTFYELVRERSAARGKRLHWISDVRNAGRMSHEARRFSASIDISAFLAGIVMFGASLHIRAVVNLVTKAGSLLQANQNHPPTLFVATEADARAHVEARRREHSA